MASLTALLAAAHPALGPALLSWLDARSLGRVSSTSPALRQAITATADADALWTPHFLRAFPGSEALLHALRARGQSVGAYYALRHQKPRGPPYHRRTPAEEEARLRREVAANTYLELEVKDKDTGLLLASRLVSLAEEEDVALAFFQGERVPLTVQLDEKPCGLDEEMNISRSATLLRVGAKPQVFHLAAHSKEGCEGDWTDKPDGSLEIETSFDDCACPYLPEHCRIYAAGYMCFTSVHQTIHKVRGVWELSMEVKIILDMGHFDVGLRFPSIRDVLGFVEFLFAGLPLWRMRDSRDRTP